MSSKLAECIWLGLPFLMRDLGELDVDIERGLKVGAAREGVARRAALNRAIEGVEKSMTDS